VIPRVVRPPVGTSHILHAIGGCSRHSVHAISMLRRQLSLLALLGHGAMSGLESVMRIKAGIRLRPSPPAGLPARYTPHGLRKRCLTDMAEDGKTIHQIMSVSGHLTAKEVMRYTEMADWASNARAAMAGRV
jgi:hypothetical protein